MQPGKIGISALQTLLAATTTALVCIVAVCRQLVTGAKSELRNV